MAVVARKPKAANQPDQKKIDAFIEGKAEDSGDEQVKITLRCSAEWLKRVDRAAKARGINRSAWLKFAASEAMDAQG